VFKVRHSLHWSPRRAPVFYLIYAGLLVVSAIVVLIPNAPLGLITTGVQALAGILLPSATVFLVLLCNDKDVLGPWINTPIRNVVAGAIVWILILMSLALTAATMFPKISGSELTSGLLIGAGVGALAGLAGFVSSKLPSRKKEIAMGEADHPVEHFDKDTWRTPPLDTLPKAKIHITSRVGLTVLRLYLVMAVVLVVIKVAQLAGH
ncbi:manganese transporter NRAMP, partial [mine drainage metagenome]